MGAVAGLGGYAGDPNSPKAYAVVRRSGHGSPTKFKGKRESLPPGAVGGSPMKHVEMGKPANMQHMAMTQMNNAGSGGFMFNTPGRRSTLYEDDIDDDFNTMVVLQPSVSSCGLQLKA